MSEKIRHKLVKKWQDENGRNQKTIFFIKNVIRLKRNKIRSFFYGPLKKFAVLVVLNNEALVLLCSVLPAVEFSVNEISKYFQTGLKN